MVKVHITWSQFPNSTPTMFPVLLYTIDCQINAKKKKKHVYEQSQSLLNDCCTGLLQWFVLFITNTNSMCPDAKTSG